MTAYPLLYLREAWREAEETARARATLRVQRGEGGGVLLFDDAAGRPGLIAVGAPQLADLLRALDPELVLRRIAAEQRLVAEQEERPDLVRGLAASYGWTDTAHDTTPTSAGRLYSQG